MSIRHSLPRNALTAPILLSAVILVVFACSGGSGTQGLEPGTGRCADKCPKACHGDAECDVSHGELCCDFGGDGKACVAANKCPRFCSSDDKCDTADGEGCLRTTLASPRLVCSAPKDAVKLCTSDAQCDAESVCCGIYKEPVCLPPDRCPVICTRGDECNSGKGEVCCTTLALVDPTVGASGLCIDPKTQPCPQACTVSADCDTKAGDICCEGTCKKSCDKTCSSSNDCSGQICCLTPAANSPFMRGIKSRDIRISDLEEARGQEVAGEAQAAIAEELAALLEPGLAVARAVQRELELAVHATPARLAAPVEAALPVARAVQREAELAVHATMAVAARRKPAVAMEPAVRLVPELAARAAVTVLAAQLKPAVATEPAVRLVPEPAALEAAGPGVQMEAEAMLTEASLSLRLAPPRVTRSLGCGRALLPGAIERLHSYLPSRQISETSSGNLLSVAVRHPAELRQDCSDRAKRQLKEWQLASSERLTPCICNSVLFEIGRWSRLLRMDLTYSPPRPARENRFGRCNPSTKKN
jgi:hypothetical protein